MLEGTFSIPWPGYPTSPATDTPSVGPEQLARSERNRSARQSAGKPTAGVRHFSTGYAPTGGAPSGQASTASLGRASNTGKKLSDPDAQRDLRPLPEYIAGPENLLLESLRTWAENSSDDNPLVLYGPSGVGKSHLARGLAAAWREQAGAQRRATIVVDAVQFAREFAEAVEIQAVPAWRQRYRQADLLVVEDVAGLIDKPAAQEELVSLLDGWDLSAQGPAIEQGSLTTPAEIPGSAGNLRVLVTCGVAPWQLADLSARLRSRLVGGLAVPVHPPGESARAEIILRLARQRQLNFQQLRGLIVQLAAAEASGSLATPESIRQLLSQRQSTAPSLTTIANQTARHFGIPVGQLRGPSRQKGVVQARGVAMYLARELTGLSLQRIGQHFGGRDHTTVMHACRRVDSLMQTDKETQDSVATLQGVLS